MELNSGLYYQYGENLVVRLHARGTSHPGGTNTTDQSSVCLQHVDFSALAHKA